MPEEPDVVVVGGGIAGLAAATTAARHGSKVVLVDAHHLGGRAQSDHRRGFTFNRGPNGLYDRGAGREAVLIAHLAGVADPQRSAHASRPRVVRPDTDIAPTKADPGACGNVSPRVVRPCHQTPERHRLASGTGPTVHLRERS